MNFKTVLENVLSAFQAEGVRYALIGGYAVGLWGVARGTVAVDFLVLRDDLDKLDRIMAGLGYELHHRSENVSQYISEKATFGEIDFLHAFRTHARQMIERAVEKTIFQGKLRVSVLLPEDLIGLKIQAIANNESRESLDMYDVEELMRLHASRMDWKLLEEYFTIFAMQDLFARLKGTYHAAV